MYHTMPNYKGHHFLQLSWYFHILSLYESYQWTFVLMTMGLDASTLFYLLRTMRRSEMLYTYLVGSLNIVQILRAASHCGRRSRGRRFPQIRLQEIQNSTSRSFTLARGQSLTSLFKMLTWQYSLSKVTEYKRKFGLDKNENPNYGCEAVDIFHDFFI
jgi:hypothetical protein